MQEFKYIIKDAQGIHARPAGALVKEAAAFPCSIKIIKDEKEADAKRILGVMGLGAKCNDEITILADGEKEEEAIQKLKSFMEANL